MRKSSKTFVSLEGLNDEDVVLLAGACETPVGRACLRALSIEAERVERRLEDPRLNTERVRDDFRHVVGERRGVGHLEQLVASARNQLGMDLQTAF
jgi:hypothetical protein